MYLWMVEEGCGCGVVEEGCGCHTVQERRGEAVERVAAAAVAAAAAAAAAQHATRVLVSTVGGGTQGCSFRRGLDESRGIQGWGCVCGGCKV